MHEFDKKEQQRISSLEQMDRYLIDPRDHVLRSFDGRPVMQEKTMPVIILIIAFIIFKRFYKLNDERMKEISEQIHGDEAEVPTADDTAEGGR